MADPLVIEATGLRQVSGLVAKLNEPTAAQGQAEYPARLGDSCRGALVDGSLNSNTEIFHCFYFQVLYFGAGERVAFIGRES